MLIAFYVTGIDFMFLVNINFLIITLLLAIYSVKNTKLSKLSLIFVALMVVSVLKVCVYMMPGYEFELGHAMSYFAAVLIPYFSINLANSFEKAERQQVENIFRKFARNYAFIAFPGLVVYFILYLQGNIVYFGMGSNLHYIFPFFLTKGIAIPTIAFLAIILISGKRSVLVNFLAQCTAVYFPYLWRNPIFLGIVLGTVVLLSNYLIANTELLNRVTMFLEKDITNPDDLAILLSGRFEEFLGIYEYFSKHPSHIFLGSPPGAFYHWIVPLSDYEATKNYSHFTPFGYLFRYGLLFSVLIYGCFIHALIKFRSSRDPFYLVFVGIFTSSFFGANLVIDPLSWIFIGLLYRLSKP